MATPAPDNSRYHRAGECNLKVERASMQAILLTIIVLGLSAAASAQIAPDATEVTTYRDLAGANVNLADRMGATPLTLARNRGYAKMVAAGAR